MTKVSQKSTTTKSLEDFVRPIPRRQMFCQTKAPKVFQKSTTTMRNLKAKLGGHNRQKVVEPEDHDDHT